MASSKDNILLAEFSGKIGNLIVKTYSYGTVISKFPDMSNAGKTAKQGDARVKFKAAQAYAKQLINDPEKKKALSENLAPGKSVYHAALSAYMKADAKEEARLLNIS